MSSNIYIYPSLKAELQFFFIAFIEICLAYERNNFTSSSSFLQLYIYIYIYKTGTKNDEDGQLGAKKTIYNKKSKKIKSFNKKRRFGR